VTAFEADAQVNPCIANFQAILATIGGGLYVTNLIEMAASGWHWCG